LNPIGSPLRSKKLKKRHISGGSVIDDLYLEVRHPKRGSRSAARAPARHGLELCKEKREIAKKERKRWGGALSTSAFMKRKP